MSEYDPFNLPEPTAEERQQKHFLDSNGLWLNSRYSFLNAITPYLCADISGNIGTDFG